MLALLPLAKSLVAAFIFCSDFLLLLCYAFFPVLHRACNVPDFVLLSVGTL